MVATLMTGPAFPGSTGDDPPKSSSHSAPDAASTDADAASTDADAASAGPDADPSGTRPLAGKRAIVSGAGRGIGRGIALSLAQAGADVAINDRPGNQDAEDTVADCGRFGVRSLLAAADVTDAAAVRAAFQRVVDSWGGIDLVVSNAAYSDRRLMVDQPEEEFHRTLQVSLHGAYHFVRSGAEQMISGGHGGSIVVISSPHAHNPVPGAMAYNIAKAGCDQLARTAACELAGHDIRVNLIHPGWIDTPGERKFFSEETLQEGGSKIPQGRLGTPADIGRGVVFLCDPASQYITGSTLTIDGGIQLPFHEMYRIEEAAKAST